MPGVAAGAGAKLLINFRHRYHSTSHGNPSCSSMPLGLDDFLTAEAKAVASRLELARTSAVATSPDTAACCSPS
jgi:hypothetical protein